MRTLVTLACTECKRRNYTTKKNKQNNPDRIELKKYSRKQEYRPVVQLVEQRSPKPQVVGSSPTWPASLFVRAALEAASLALRRNIGYRS